MNKRIEELAKEAGMTRDKFGMYFAARDHNEDGVDLEKFAELIVRELVSTIAVDWSSDGFYYNEFNDYGCIIVRFYVDGDPFKMKGEEITAKFSDGVTKGTGRVRLNEHFVEHLMEKTFGVEE